jgi:hypothetical protein
MTHKVLFEITDDDADTKSIWLDCSEADAMAYLRLAEEWGCTHELAWHAAATVTVTVSGPTTSQAERQQTDLEWAVARWNDEVRNRPIINVNRRPLDDTWRQVIRHFGGDPDTLLSLPSHDTLVMQNPGAFRDAAAARSKSLEEELRIMDGGIEAMREHDCGPSIATPTTPPPPGA